MHTYVRTYIVDVLALSAVHPGGPSRHPSTVGPVKEVLGEVQSES